MVKSTIVDSDIRKSTYSRVRTSSGTFLARGCDKIIQTIEKRIADFTFLPVAVGSVGRRVKSRRGASLGARVTTDGNLTHLFLLRALD
ncbi:hypothetical protein Tco_0505585 [Tanacetum coccineum]